MNTRWLEQIIGRAENRTPQQIDADVRDELEFHEACLCQRFEEEGQSPPAAAARARECIGDTTKYAKQCRNIALKERIMLQRVNFVLLIVVIAGMVLLGVGMARAMSLQARSMAGMYERMGQMAREQEERARKAEAEVARLAVQRREQPQSSAAEAGSDSNMVYVSGSVPRPGVYLATPGLTLRRLLSAASAESNQISLVQVIRTKNGEEKVVFELEKGDLNDAEGKDVEVESNDRVIVK